MKIIIAGIGKVGTLVARYLSKEDHIVTIIDENPEIIKEITDNQSIAGIVGKSTSIDSLIEADIKNTDLFIALTTNDETNILSCILANIYGVNNNIARISNSNYLEENWQELFRLKQIPINSVISSWFSIINIIKQKIKYSYIDISDIIDFENEEAKIFSLICNNQCTQLGSNILEIEQNASNNNIIFKIVGIFKNGNFRIPNGKDIIEEGNKIFISTTANFIDESYNMFYNKKDFDTKLIESQNPNIILYGDHEFINKIAITLSTNYNKIKVIKNNKDKENNNKNAIILEKYKIQFIQDDITKNEYRKNYLKSQDDIIIIFNKKDEDTILNTLILKNQKIGNIFCCLNNSTYENFLISNNVNNIIVPDYFIMSTILANLRRGIVYNVYSLYNIAEIIEIEASENSNVIGKRVEDISIDKNMIVAHLIDDNDNVINFNTNTIIRNGYKIIYIVMRDYIQEIESIFTQNSNY
jgi:trk system potassium uptake protein TrkA